MTRQSIAHAVEVKRNSLAGTWLPEAVWFRSRTCPARAGGQVRRLNEFGSTVERRDARKPRYGYLHINLTILLRGAHL